ncbi:hypothetical protein M5689_006056 [Euphorbia peplus]|nr:hypothetical protein M5689_006056 [Euphorbia peplus]
MAGTIFVPIVPRIQAQKAVRKRFRDKLNRCRMAPTSRWDDVDAIVRHLVRVQNLMQCCISYNGLKDKVLRFGAVERSLIKVPRLKELYVECYCKSEMDYKRSIRLFMDDLDELGVSYPLGRKGMVLRSGNAIRTPHYGRGREHLHRTFTKQMRYDVFCSFPKRVRRDGFNPKNYE